MLSAESNAEADNTYRDLDYLGYHRQKRNLIIILLYVVLKKTKTQKHNTETDIGYLQLSRWKKIILK